MKSVELQNKTVDELYSLLEELTKELVNLKIQKSVGQLTAPHRLRLVRRNIARIKALITSIESLNVSNNANASEVA